MKRLFTFTLLLYSSFHALAQVGIGTTDPKAGLHVENGAVVFSAPSGDSESTGSTDMAGPGRRLVWYPKLSAFRVGRVDDNQWDLSNVGQNSFAAGLNSWARGEQSVAMGWGSRALGATSTALGYMASATAPGSVAIGDKVDALANGSTALGKGVIASSFGETVVGLYNTERFSANRTEWVGIDPVFEVGNGFSEQLTSSALVVLKNGNVGIGRLTPTEKLDVSGKVKALAINAENADISNTITSEVVMATSINVENAIISEGIKTGTIQAASIQSSGNVTSSGIKLATKGGNASVLDHYEEVHISGKLANGPVVFVPDYVVDVVRLGKLVTITFPKTELGMQVSENDIVFNSIPAWIRPSSDLVFPINTQTGGVASMGVAVVRKDGFVYFKPDEKGSRWGGANSGFYATSVSYVIK
jgi:hypothetical protein